LILGEPVKSLLEEKKYEDFGKLSDDISDKMPAYDIFSDEIDKMTADLRTDLDSFHDIEIDMLMWAGAVRMDIAVKRYLKKFLSEEKFQDVPKRPPYSIERIKEILTKGRRAQVPLGFLHKNVKAV
jgi:NTE family protein